MRAASLLCIVQGLVADYGALYGCLAGCGNGLLQFPINNKSRLVWTETRQYKKCERGRTKITRTLITQSFPLRS
uniref:Putative secreted protein n=1 Tax=Ixodes ricinus TaxID=34613 RepID=A0A6B0U3I1_IXORI